jgi:hypothetical protein
MNNWGRANASEFKDLLPASFLYFFISFAVRLSALTKYTPLGK